MFPTDTAEDDATGCRFNTTVEDVAILVSSARAGDTAIALVSAVRARILNVYILFVLAVSIGCCKRSIQAMRYSENICRADPLAVS